MAGPAMHSRLSWSEKNDFPDHLLPKIVPAGTSVGCLQASLKGWPTGVPVSVAMGDCQCAMFATLKESSDAAINISTSIQLGFVIPMERINQVHEKSPPSISFFPYFKGQMLALCAGLNGGNAVFYFVTCIANWMTELGICDRQDVNTIMNRLQTLAEDSKETSASSVTISPAFFGERHDPALRGHITGISSDNFCNIGPIFRSICEGIVDHLHGMVPADYLLRMGISRLLVSGSVPASNAIVKQRLIQLFAVGSDLIVLLDDESTNAVRSPIGAAMIARSLKVYDRS